MAKQYSVEVYGQVSLFSNNNRKFKVFFSEPNSGVNDKTGILLLIAGYGAEANSNIYKKMRDKFADEYNLITIQCNYMGYEFMDKANNIKFNLSNFEKKLNEDEKKEYIKKPEEYIKKMAYNKQMFIEGYGILHEKRENLNDMGPIQAIDNLTAIYVVKHILQENNLNYDVDKVIIYGHSHGAYLGYLCNAFAPNLISTLIDNSAYLYPIYLNKSRRVEYSYGKSILSLKYSYLINKLQFDSEIYNLNRLYNQFENNAKIISFHGENDIMTETTEKVNFIKKINNANIEVIKNEDIDNVIYTSTNHGLGADFIKLFQYVANKYRFEEKEKFTKYDKVEFSTEKYMYNVDHIDGIPYFNYKKLEL